MAPRAKLTQYEKRRLENIKRNDQMLAALKIQSRVAELSVATKRQKPQTKTFKMSPEKSQKNKPPVVLRRSLRTRGMAPDTSTADGLKDKFKKNSRKETTEELPPEPVSMRMVDACWDKDDASNRKFIDTYLVMPMQPQLDEGNEDSYDTKESVEIGLRRYKTKSRASGFVDVESMKLDGDHVARIVPGRIFSVRFFPTNNLSMIVAGDKIGNVGFWNINSQGDDGDGFYLYHPHSAPVSAIIIEPFSIPKMYTSSYDGIVRLMDVEKELFDILFSSEYNISAMSQRQDDLNSLYLSEGDGELSALDVRSGKKSLASLCFHHERINTIDFNPENPNIMATSSRDSTASIWDLRKIHVDKPVSMKTVNHERSVQSAYFSPSGRCIATTSYSNNVGLLSGANYEDLSMVYHNNNTGRWLSPFRGIWGWDDSHIFIGSMSRGVDIISAESKRIVTTLQSEHMTAISARFDAHRYKIGTLASATAGGQVYIWTMS